MMTQKQLSNLYEAGVMYETYIYVAGPLIWVLLAVAEDRNGNHVLLLIAGEDEDDKHFPAIGPLKSFDHAWSVLTMRGYTVRGYGTD